MFKTVSKHPAMLSTADIGVFLVLSGAVFSGLRPLFARLLSDDGITAVITALYCYLGSAVLFFPIGMKRHHQSDAHKRAALLAVISGLFVGIGGAAYFEALDRLPVATVTLVYFTYPAMVIFVQAIFHRRWPRRPAWMGIACVTAGIYFIVGNGIHSPSISPTDFLIAFIAPLSWTVLLIFLAGPLTVLSPYARIGFITLGAVLIMSVAAIVQQSPALWAHSITGWIGLLCMVGISGVFSHLLTTVGVQKAGSERSSFAGVFEIATSLVIGWVIFSEPISVGQITGLFFIVAAVVLTRRLEVGFSAGNK